ncbi:hypothetical protein RM780_23770 [Streptomyces sp. DSM 44917]|uniref:Uncharacterized protein n=1 Tax=Streptomyces boetiae TaxID=3075541 RepID=A0ABU2LED8_9ACTN|nr:hypothetical protein [Streptomyces sp. DSM 44917]MDT0309948.1 hypothetical protein [Streptomyces sp. DSM 44917]
MSDTPPGPAPGSGLPPDLAWLKALAAWLEGQLASVRAAIDAEEERAGPRWWVQWMRTAPGEPRRGVLHRAGCWCPGEPDLYEAGLRRVAARHGAGIETCPVCRAAVPGQERNGPVTS